MDLSEEFYHEVRPLLFALAYRMLGSAVESEDIIQDAFIKISSIEEEKVTNPKAYLCKIVTNACLDKLKSAQKRKEVYIGPCLPEPVAWKEENHPYKQVLENENLSLAYLKLMESLKPKERAVFLLRVGMNLSYKQIANILDTTEENCRKLLSRGKQKLGKQHDENSFSIEENNNTISQFLDAFQSGNVENLLSLIAEDVVLYSDGGGKVIAATEPIMTRKNVIAFLNGIFKRRPDNHRFKIHSINGELGIINKFGDTTHSTVSFYIKNNQIHEIYYIVNPDKLKNVSV